ncbi:MAG: TIGR00730 family Rossman fold protein [Lawsonella sp.]
MRALIIVDVQLTFCSGGELGVPGGHDVADRIADLLRTHADDYDLIVTTQDWHIAPGDHFSTEPDYVDTWPAHGVAGSTNAELHPRIVEALAQMQENHPGLPYQKLLKGQYAASYSGFDGVNQEGESLVQILRNHEITQVDVVGLALSHCVAATSLDAVQNGFIVKVFRDLTRPVTVESGLEAVEKLEAAGVIYTHSPHWTFACYTASRTPDNPVYTAAADELGEALGQAGHSIVYGGGNCGLMGIVADAALETGASVYGIIPEHFDGHEVEHLELTRLERVDTMATRKARMAELADCFIALPGGVGTLEEIFEVWSQQYLGMHAKPVVFYNTNGYWDTLLQALDEFVEVGTLDRQLRENLIVVDNPTDLLETLGIVA